MKGQFHIAVFTAGKKEPERITVECKSTGKPGVWVGRCPLGTHEDKDPSFYVYEATQTWHCFGCGLTGPLWDDKYKEGSYRPKTKKDYLQEENKEIKSDIFSAIDVDIENWSAYDEKIKEEVRRRIPHDLCFIPEDERGLVMGSIVKAGIFRITELRDRVKLMQNFLKKIKGTKKEEEKKKAILTKGWFPGLISLIKVDDIVHYLLDKDNKLYTAETVTINNQEYKPKQDLPIYYATKKVFNMPRDINFAFLLNDVERFIRRYVEMPDESDYFLLSLWVFHTYIAYREFITPYLYFYGAYETGKSQAGDALLHLAFNAEPLTNVTSASVFRGIGYYKPTLIIDEIKLWGYGSNPDLVSVILSGCQKKDTVPRIDMNEKRDIEDQIKYYPTYCPKVMCSTEPIDDRIKSRCLHFIMKRNVREAVEDLIDLSEKALEQAEYLRNCLTLFRANFLNKKFKKLEKIARRRLRQVLTPLYRIVMEIVPAREEEFREIVKQLSQKKKEIKTLSLEAEIIEIFVGKAKNGIFSIGSKDLCDTLNMDRSKTAEISTAKLKIRMSPLGFEKTKSQPREWSISEERLKNLKEEYL